MRRSILFSALVAALVGSSALAQTTRGTTNTRAGATFTNDGLFTNRGPLDLRMAQNGNLNAGGFNNSGFTQSPFQWIPGVGFLPLSPGTPGAFGNGFNQGFANNGFNNGFANNGFANNGFNQGFANNGFNNGFANDGFNNGFANNGFNNGFMNNGFGLGVNPGFDPFFGNGGWGGYGPAFSGPLVNTIPAWQQNTGAGAVGMRGTGWNGTGIPTLGMNVAPGGMRLPARGVRVKMTTDATASQRIAGTRQDGRGTRGGDEDTGIQGEIRGGDQSAEQVQLATRLEDVMQDRPLVEGTVVSMGATGAQIRYSANGERRTERFPVEEVFFFERNGSLASASTDPSLIRVGSRVLVPQPLIRPELRQSVAGSREEMRGDTEGTISVQPKTRATAKKKVTKRSTRTNRR